MDDAVTALADTQSLLHKLDYWYCCDAVADTELVRQADALCKRLPAKQLPPGLQARAVWRFLRKEGTHQITKLGPGALDALGALAQVAAAARIPPPGPLLLQVRAAGR
jgi:hypothetical protein